MTDVDLAIVGGGPVGLACALYAQRSGLRAVVIEPRATPIDKACGEGLMPAGVAALAQLGVHPDGWPLRGIRYAAGDRSVTADFASGPGRGVQRTTLHNALANAVAARGVDILQAKVVAAEQDSVVRLRTEVARRGRGPLVRARYVVAADGLHSRMRRLTGLDRPTSGRPRHGQRRHFAIAPWSDHVEVHWGRDAELYVTPVGPGLVGIAALTRESTSFDALLGDFLEVAEKVCGTEASEVRGASGLRQRSRRRTTGRLLLVGDAAGYVDALTGEGVALGLAQAEGAVAAILEDNPTAYEKHWREVTRIPDALTATLVGATRLGLARRLLVPAAAALPGVFTHVVNLVSSSPGRPIPMSTNGIRRHAHG